MTTNPEQKPFAIETQDLQLYSGSFQAVKDVNLQIEPLKITAMIGPSGCGRLAIGAIWMNWLK